MCIIFFAGFIWEALKGTCPLMLVAHGCSWYNISMRSCSWGMSFSVEVNSDPTQARTPAYTTDQSSKTIQPSCLISFIWMMCSVCSLYFHNLIMLTVHPENLRLELTWALVPGSASLKVEFAIEARALPFMSISSDVSSLIWQIAVAWVWYVWSSNTFRSKKLVSYGLASLARLLGCIMKMVWCDLGAFSSSVSSAESRPFQRWMLNVAASYERRAKTHERFYMIEIHRHRFARHARKLPFEKCEHWRKVCGRSAKDQIACTLQ